MSALTKTRHTDFFEIIILRPHSKKVSYTVKAENFGRLETYLEKYSEDDSAAVAWETLAKERIKKYKKAGLVLRGIRYREGLSQKRLAEKSGVNQNEISKIENGKRAVGEKVAKRLAKALNIDFRLFTEA